MRWGLPAFFAEMLPCCFEISRVCALEREDRLFFVTDDEQAAGPDNLGLPGEELLGQRFEDVPHVRRCILRFIDQDVVNGGVELHHDPAGMPGADQPTQCCDQVIEIESIARLLRASKA